MKQEIPSSWGAWISRRAEYLGFKRQADLAGAVGASRLQVNAWMQLSTPPARMRKGFDRSLAYALQTTKQMLFVDWRGVAPEDAERIAFHVDQMEDVGTNANLDPALYATVHAVVNLLRPSEAEELLRELSLRILQKNDVRSAAVRRITERFGVIERFLAAMHGGKKPKDEA